MTADGFGYLVLADTLVDPLSIEQRQAQPANNSRSRQMKADAQRPS